VIAAGSVLFVYMIIKRDKSLINHMGFTTGYVSQYKLRVNNAPTMNYDIYFNYIVKGEKYTEVSGGPESKGGIGNEFIGKTFLVVYDTLHPDNASILIFPHQYKNFNLPFPQNLNWIIPVIKNYNVSDSLY
jgi:hypothetical protein